MNPPAPRHLSEEQLLRYSDGELPRREAAAVRAHLEACWECRTGLEELKKTVGDCVRFRKAVLERYMPPPPASWFDIRREISEVDQRQDSRSVWAAAGEFLLAPARRPRQWAAGAAALLAIAAIVHELWNAPRVEAAELLRKAAMSTQTREPLRRIRIRKGSRQITRVVGSARNVGAREASAPDTEAIRSLFVAANYDWEDPLSAPAYLAWHEQLPTKQDEVIQGSASYLIRTTTAASELVEATLRLREADLRAVEGTFRFRNQEPVEVTELPLEAPPADTPRASAAFEVPSSPPAATVQPPPVEVSPGEELRVIAALHSIGADLGDPVEITRAEDRILVTGIGLSPERRDEIARTLVAMPRVAVRFHDSDAVDLPPAPPPPERRSKSGGDTGRLAARIEEHLGGRPAFDRFADQLLEYGDTLMAHAHALRRLAERFPPEAESRLSAEDRQVLEGIRTEHGAAINRQAEAVHALVHPLLRELGIRPAASPSSSAGLTWQARAKERFEAARQVERRSAALVAGAAPEEGGGALGPGLLAGLEHLRSFGER
jgi:anti-sigma factor RsiW